MSCQKRYNEKHFKKMGAKNQGATCSGTRGHFPGTEIFKEHMHTEKTRLQHQIWPQKRGQFLDLQFAPFPIEGWFWGPLVGPRNGPRNSAFFLLLLPYHLGPNIWPAWPQLQRFSACQTGFTTKGSTCSKCSCTIIIICDQHSYCDCKHTHTLCTAKNMLQNRRLKSP